MSCLFFGIDYDEINEASFGVISSLGALFMYGCSGGQFHEARCLACPFPEPPGLMLFPLSHLACPAYVSLNPTP